MTTKDLAPQFEDVILIKPQELTIKIISIFSYYFFAIPIKPYGIWVAPRGAATNINVMLFTLIYIGNLS